MSRLAWWLLAGSAAVVAGACGYPTISYGPPDGGTTSVTGTGGATTSTTSTDSTSSTSGTTTSTTSSSTTTTSTTTTSTTTAPTCSPIEGACTGGKCSVDPATSEIRCIALAASPKGAWGACKDDSECAIGHYCDPHTKVCKPTCSVVSDCTTSPGAQCVPATDAGGYKIKGLSVCIADCDPQSATSCGPDGSCAWDLQAGTSGAFDCFVAGTLAYWDPCKPGLPLQCQAGLLCAIDYCEPWCTTPGGAACSTGESCLAFDSTTPIHAGVTYGFCY